MTKDTKNNLNPFQKEDYVFYHQTYNLFFISKANQVKTLIELYIKILKLLPPEKLTFDLSNLSLSEKARMHAGFKRIVEKDQFYLGWKVVKASEWDPKKFLNPVNNEEFFEEKSSLIETQEGANKFDLTEIFENVSKFLKSYFLESAFNEFQQFILTLKNNDKKIIATRLSDKILKAEFKAFSQPNNEVFSQKTMINFLNQSGSFSLYHRLCLWFLNLKEEQYYKPFKLKSKQILCFEKHHIIPRYLNDNHQLNGSLENAYNLIKIPRLVHILLHFIRTIEFEYYEDQNYVKSLGPTWNTYIKNESNILEFNTVFKNCLQTLNTSLKNNLNFQKPKKEFFVKRDAAIETSLNTTIKETFSEEMTWVNRDYPINDIIIAPNVMRKVRDLFDFLIQELENYFQDNSENLEVSKPKDWNKLLISRNNYDYFSNYLKGDVASQNPLFGWVLLNPNQKMISRAQKTKKIQLRGTTFNFKVSEMLDKGGYVWTNQKFGITPIQVMPGQFKTMMELADYLVLKMPENKQPRGWFTQDKKSKQSRLCKGFTKVVITGPGGLTNYFGWELKKK